MSLVAGPAAVKLGFHQEFLKIVSSSHEPVGENGERLTSMTSPQPSDLPVVVAQGDLARMRELGAVLAAAGIASALLPPGGKRSS